MARPLLEVGRVAAAAEYCVGSRTSPFVTRRPIKTLSSPLCGQPVTRMQKRARPHPASLMRLWSTRLALRAARMAPSFPASTWKFSARMRSRMPSGLGRLTIHAIRGMYSIVRLARAACGVSLAPSGRMRTRLHAYGQPGLAARDGIALCDELHDVRHARS